MFFPNFYTDWGGGAYSWNGFVVSNYSDNQTPGFGNQYSAFTGKGFGSFSNYSIVYVSHPVTYANSMFVILKGDAKGGHLKDIAVTNSTYAALAMRHGDQYSKKFGGETGDDPDWFLLEIIAWYKGEPDMANRIRHYLADYRYEDNSKDFIQNEWQLVNLENLGRADSLEFRLSSSDNGQWGMNTPAYFAIGQITTMDDGGTTSTGTPLPASSLRLCPNPASSSIVVEHPANISGNEKLQVSIYDMKGRLMIHQESVSSAPIQIDHLPGGQYIVRLSGKYFSERQIFLKQ